MFEIKEQHLGFFSISWFASAVSTHPSIKTNSQCTGKSTVKSIISSSNYKAMRITIKSWLGLGSVEQRSQSLESTPAAEEENLDMTRNQCYLWEKSKNTSGFHHWNYTEYDQICIKYKLSCCA